MNVIVAINCKDKKCLENRLKEAKKFLPKNSPIHIDISKKGFSPVNSFFDFNLLIKYSKYFKFDGHLMVSKEDALDKKWFLSPLKTLFFHTKINPDWEKIFELSKKYKKEIGAVIVFNENKNKIFIPRGIKKILVLAVVPGKSGQKFNSKALKLIRFLRKKYPYVKISVDGGVNERIAESVKRMGASEIVSESFIWENKNPKFAYKELSNI